MTKEQFPESRWAEFQSACFICRTEGKPRWDGECWMHTRNNRSDHCEACIPVWHCRLPAEEREKRDASRFRELADELEKDDE